MSLCPKSRLKGRIEADEPRSISLFWFRDAGGPGSPMSTDGRWTKLKGISEMNTIKRATFRKRLFGGAIVIGLACAGSAHACDTPGFLAQMAAPVIGCSAAQAGDRINAPGHYVEAGVAAGANALLPGSGPVVAGGFALQQSGALSAFNPPAGAPMPPPSFGGVPVPRFGRAPFPAPAPVGFAIGNFCATPIGLFGPGAPAPIGSVCWLPNGVTGVIR